MYMYITYSIRSLHAFFLLLQILMHIVDANLQNLTNGELVVAGRLCPGNCVKHRQGRILLGVDAETRSCSVYEHRVILRALELRHVEPFIIHVQARHSFRIQRCCQKDFPTPFGTHKSDFTSKSLAILVIQNRAYVTDSVTGNTDVA